MTAAWLELNNESVKKRDPVRGGVNGSVGSWLLDALNERLLLSFHFPDAFRESYCGA